MIDTIGHGTIRELHFNRPPANAFSPELLVELRTAVEAAPENGAAALVLSGSEGMFSGGLDVPALLALDRDGLTSAVHALFDLVTTLVASPIPVAAAITGHSPAAGAVIALCCDHRVMADGDFVIGVNEVHVGLPMPEVVVGLLQRQVGPRLAEQLCVTGRLLPPAEALRIGLVDEVVPAAQVIPRAVEWCQMVAGIHGRAVRLTRQTARQSFIESVAELAAGDKERFPEEWFHPEVQEGLLKLAEQLRSKRRG